MKKDTKSKKIDDLERLRLIKEWLPDMVSANIELVINMAVRQLRKSTIREFQDMMRFANDPTILKVLRNNP